MEALAVYRRGEWPEAMARWKAVASHHSEDPVARVFVRRLREWSERGFPELWEGVTTLQWK